MIYIYNTTILLLYYSENNALMNWGGEKIMKYFKSILRKKSGLSENFLLNFLE